MKDWACDLENPFVIAPVAPIFDCDALGVCAWEAEPGLPGVPLYFEKGMFTL